MVNLIFAVIKFRLAHIDLKVKEIYDYSDESYLVIGQATSKKHSVVAPYYLANKKTGKLSFFDVGEHIQEFASIIKDPERLIRSLKG